MSYLKLLSVKAWAGIVAFLTLAFAVLKSRYDNMRRKQAEKRAEEDEQIIDDIGLVKRNTNDPDVNERVRRKYDRD